MWETMPDERPVERPHPHMNAAPLLSAFAVLLFLAVLLFGKGVRLYTDWLWFADVGYTGVFMAEFRARLGLGVLAAAATFFWTWAQFRAARSDGARPPALSGWM